MGKAREDFVGEKGKELGIREDGRIGWLIRMRMRG